MKCDKCGETPFWSLPRVGDRCPCGGKLVSHAAFSHRRVPLDGSQGPYDEPSDGDAAAIPEYVDCPERGCDHRIPSSDASANRRLFPDGCTCQSYGHGLTMTRVASASCPAHGGGCDVTDGEWGCVLGRGHGGPHRNSEGTGIGPLVACYVPPGQTMYEVIWEWLSENNPAALELCPYKVARRV